MQKVCRVILRQGHFQQEGKHESLSCIANNSVCTNNKWEKEVFATTKRWKQYHSKMSCSDGDHPKQSCSQIPGPGLSEQLLSGERKCNEGCEIPDRNISSIQENDSDSYRNGYMFVKVMEFIIARNYSFYEANNFIELFHSKYIWHFLYSYTLD